MVRGFLRAVLERAGFRTLEATDGRDVLRTLQDQPADLVRLDLVMPDKDGMETIIELRRDRPDVPVIAMSGAAGGPAYLGAASLPGARAVLTEPIDAPTLLDRVREVLPATPRQPGAPPARMVRPKEPGDTMGVG